MLLFSSFKDSAIALEALTNYALEDDNRNLYNMRLKVEATSVPDWKRQIDISKAANNFAIYRSLEVFMLIHQSFHTFLSKEHKHTMKHRKQNTTTCSFKPT